MKFPIEEQMRIPLFVCFVFCAGQPLMAQNSTRTSSPPSLSGDHFYRDPATAAVFGTIIPGAGHVYSTEYFRGASFFIGSAGSIGMGSLIYSINKCTFAFLDPNCDPRPEWPHRTLGLVLIGCGVASWAYSAIDAPRAARRANESHRRSAQMRPFIEPRNSNRVDVGMAVSW